MENYGNEVIQEMVVSTSSSYHMRIDIDFSDKFAVGFIKDPYFKVYDSINRTKGTRIARISILRPEYVYHKNGYDKSSAGKDDYHLSKKEIIFMKTMLKSPYTINGIPYKSAWVGMLATIKDFGVAKGLIDPNDKSFTKIKMPDYDLYLR